MRARAGTFTRRVGTGIVMVAAATAGLAPAVAGAGTGRTPVPIRARMRAAAATLHRASIAGTASGAAVVTASSSGDGWVSQSDPAGDTDARADITNVAARLQGGRIRLGLTMPDTPNPATDDSWQAGATYAAWQIDATLDNEPDYDVFVFAVGSRFFGGVVSDPDGTFECNANAGYNAGTQTFSATVPLRCLGNPPGVIFDGASQYDTEPFDDVFDGVQDLAPDTDGILVGIGTASPTLAGGYVVDGTGRMRPFGAGGSVTATVTGNPSFAVDLVRGVSATGDGGHAYVLDAYGGLHAVGFGANDRAVATEGGPYWPGWNIARGVAVAADARGGYVADAFGGLHPFGVGERRTIPKVIGGPYWVGWDIVRGVATLPDGSGGWVLDGLGGLHWFSLGHASTAPALSGLPYWPGQDRARGITITPSGSGGYVVDAAGRLYPFGIGGRPAPPAASAPTVGARGVTTVPTPVPLPAVDIGP